MNENNFRKYINKFEEIMPGFHKIVQSPDPDWASEIDLTVSQCMVLKNLAQNDNCKMSDLSSALFVTLANMTSMADRMERDGYLKRVADPEDRRIVRIKMTPKGKNVVKKMQEQRLQSLTSALSRITDEEKEKLLKIMSKIAEA